MPNLDLWPILEQLEIRTKNAKIMRLRRDAPFAWAQREFVAEIERQYNAGLPVRIIVLKGRQLGLSTLTEAVLFIWCFLHPGTNALVLSKENDDSEYLFQMTKRYWEQGPFYGMFPEKNNRIGYLAWGGVNSSIMTSTAKKADVGRGKTLQAVHCSEVAFWPMADDIVAGLSEAIAYEHGTIEVLESTAQGVGNYFHEEWTKATDPSGEKSTFTAMFFPWWEHKEYEVRDHHLTYGDLDEEERDLLETYPKMNLAKLAWRRRKLTTYANPDKFKEEYPCSESEAFLSTGSNVFNLVKLAQCYERTAEFEQGFLFNNNGRLDWQDSDKGHTFVYKRPDSRGKRRYVVAVDPTWTIEGDPACIQVMDRASLEQVAVWHGNADPKTIGEIALALAIWYGPETILNTEIQGGGKVVLQSWRDANWPNIWMDRRPDRPRTIMQAYCWNSTFEQKNMLIGTMQAAILRRQIVIHHPATYFELSRYTNLEGGEMGPARRGGHDDTVISLGIALMTTFTEMANLDWAAMSTQSPGYVPGQTPPNVADAGRATIPGLPQTNRFGDAEYDDGMMVGVDGTY